MVKLYKQENGVWIIDTGTKMGEHICSFEIVAQIVGSNIYIYRASDRFQLYGGPIAGLHNAAGVSYGTKENLFAQVGDFFVKASSGGEAVLPNADVSFYIDSMHNLILNYPDTATDDYEINADGNLVLIY